MKNKIKENKINADKRNRRCKKILHIGELNERG